MANTRGHADIQTLTAAVSAMQPGNTAELFSSRRSEEWQVDLWAYLKEVGELNYAMSFLAAAFSRVRLRIGIPDPTGNIGPAFDQDGAELQPGATAAQEILDQLRGQFGGQPHLMHQFGFNLGLVAECYLVNGEDFKGLGTGYYVMSVRELKLVNSKRGEYEWRPNGAGQPKVVTLSTDPVRIWIPDPEFSMLAHAPGRALLDILEELVLLTREVRGEILSRLAVAGILVVAEEIDFPPPEGVEDDGKTDWFTKAFTKATATAIVDKASPAGWNPFVLRIPDKYVESGIRFVEMSREWDAMAADKRKECVQRLAQGLDLPVEVVTGMRGSTFSNSFAIDESLMKIHIEPKLKLLADALTVGYLRPRMPTSSPFVIYPDATDLVLRPDQSETYRDAYDRAVINASAYRRAIAAGDNDAMSDEERAVWLEDQAARKAQPAQADGRHAPGPNRDTPEAAVAEAMIDLAVDRAIRAAGSRIRSRSNGKLGMRDRIRTVANIDVVATLGPARIREFDPDGTLLTGEFDSLRSEATKRFGPRRAAEMVAGAQGACEAMIYGRSVGIANDDGTVAPLEEVPA